MYWTNKLFRIVQPQKARILFFHTKEWNLFWITIFIKAGKVQTVFYYCLIANLTTLWPLPLRNVDFDETVNAMNQPTRFSENKKLWKIGVPGPWLVLFFSKAKSTLAKDPGYSTPENQMTPMCESGLIFIFF